MYKKSLVRKMESDEKVLQACAAIVVTDALLEKPNRKRKKWVNDYLLKRITKGSYGSLLTVFGKGNIQRIFEEDTEYLCIIRDTLCSVFLYTSEMLYTTEIQSISASCSHTEYLCMTRWVPAQHPGPFHYCHTKRPPVVTARAALRKCHCTRRIQEISEHARYVHFSAILPLHATLSELVACCGREMHSVLEPLD